MSYFESRDKKFSQRIERQRVRKSQGQFQDITLKIRKIGVNTNHMFLKLNFFIHDTL